MESAAFRGIIWAKVRNSLVPAFRIDSICGAIILSSLVLARVAGGAQGHMILSQI